MHGNARLPRSSFDTGSLWSGCRTRSFSSFGVVQSSRSSPPVSPPHVIHKIQCERRTRWYASIRSCAP